MVGGAVIDHTLLYSSLQELQSCLSFCLLFSIILQLFLRSNHPMLFIQAFTTCFAVILLCSTTCVLLKLYYLLGLPYQHWKWTKMAIPYCRVCSGSKGKTHIKFIPTFTRDPHPIVSNVEDTFVHHHPLISVLLGMRISGLYLKQSLS